MQFLCMYINLIYDNYCDLFVFKGKKAKIHEDSTGNIYITGVTTRMVKSEDEVRI